MRVTLGFGFPPRRRGFHESSEERSAQTTDVQSTQLNTSSSSSSNQISSVFLNEERVPNFKSDFSSIIGDGLKSIWDTLVSGFNRIMARIDK